MIARSRARPSYTSTNRVYSGREAEAQPVRGAEVRDDLGVLAAPG